MVYSVSSEMNGDEMYALMQRLFPICRSITGNGVRRTFQILQEHIPLKLTEVPSGTKVFDWVIPDEWNISDAYIKDSKGNKIIDFKKSNLHVVGYSIPFEGKMNLEELKSHLYSLPEQPDLIPYVTSYYERRWGFCLPHKQLQSLKDDIYEVKIDSTLECGSMTFGELIVPGESTKEILFSTYICHPSLANNELSGPVFTTFLAKHVLKNKKPYYTYRFVFVPETIGSIAYVNSNYNTLKENVIAGYVVTCVGDNSQFSYLKSRNGNAIVDRITTHVLKNSKVNYKLYDYLERGSDERQYCAPGIDLPVGSLMRSKYGEYPEYHTSGDDLDFVTIEGLRGSFDMYLKCIFALESNHRYETKVLCEPQMGRRGLYPTLSKKDSSNDIKLLMNVLAYCDGSNDLLSIAEKIGTSIGKLVPYVAVLSEHKLIKMADVELIKNLVMKKMANIGIGTDIESIGRFRDKNVLENEAFLNKVFTKVELDYCMSKSDPASSLAARFAGKEAIFKALSHFGLCQISFSEIEIVNDKNGVPQAELHSKDMDRVKIWVSLSHSDENAQAFAIVTKLL